MMFEQDEKTLQRAELLLQQGGLDEQAQAAIQELSGGYRKLVRQMRRMITMGDRMQEELQRSAHTDGLTGIANRRYFMESAQREINRSCQLGVPCALCLLDADHFKKINDTYGHDAGDKALKSIAEIMSHEIRDSDLVARFGGEEFVILLPGTSCRDAVKVTERLRQTIATTTISHNTHIFTMTVSMGLTGVTPEFDMHDTGRGKAGSRNTIPVLDQLLQYADIALYAAKKNGRNCIESYSGSVCAKRACP